MNITILYPEAPSEPFKNISKFLKEEHGISFAYDNTRVFITYHAMLGYIIYEENEDGE